MVMMSLYTHDVMVALFLPQSKETVKDFFLAVIIINLVFNRIPKTPF